MRKRWKRSPAGTRTTTRCDLLRACPRHERAPDDKSYANQLKAAADAEDRTEKATVTPGPLGPARELSAAILLDHGMAREALAAYEDAMAKEPNRFHGLAGAATAAERLGDREKARAYFGKLVSLTSGSTGDRRELIAAKEFLARP